VAGSQLFPLPFRNVGKKGTFNVNRGVSTAHLFPRSLCFHFGKTIPLSEAVLNNGEVLSAPTCPAGFARGNTLRGCAWDGLEVDKQNTYIDPSAIFAKLSVYKFQTIVLDLFGNLGIQRLWSTSGMNSWFSLLKMASEMPAEAAHWPSQACLVQL